MNIQHLISHVQRMDATLTLSAEAQWVEQLCNNFLSHTSDLQKHFVKSLLLNGIESYGIGFFSQVSFEIIGSSWAQLFGVETELLELLFEGARVYGVRQLNGEIFEGWQKLNQSFAQKLAHRLLSLSQGEDTHIWMFASNILNKCAAEKSWELSCLPEELKKYLKISYDEALADPLLILAWRLQAALPHDVGPNGKSEYGRDDLQLACRLAALVGATSLSLAAQSYTLTPESPFTVKALFQHWSRADIRALFHIELIEEWLTRGVSRALDFHLLNELFEQAFAAKLFFQVPVRLSPKLFDKGYGPTTLAIKIAAPFQQLIASALVRPQNNVVIKKRESVLS